MVELVETPRGRIDTGYPRCLHTGQPAARLDADDEALPERLALQVEAFATHPNLVLCGCAADRVDPQGTRLGRSVPPASHARLAAAMVTGNRLVHSTVRFRRNR